MAWLKTFARSDDGAVAVDWTVLTAALVGLGISAATAVRTGTGALGDDIRASLENGSVSRILTTVAEFSFDDVTGLTRTGWGWVATGSYGGWTATGPTQQIEIVESGHRGVHSPDGRNWVDLDASPGNLTLSRDLDTLEPGREYRLMFNAADSSLVNGVDIYVGGVLQQSISPGSIQFQAFEVPFVASGEPGANQIEFRGTGVPNGYGVSLHGIRIE